MCPTNAIFYQNSSGLFLIGQKKLRIVFFFNQPKLIDSSSLKVRLHSTHSSGLSFHAFQISVFKILNLGVYRIRPLAVA